MANLFALLKHWNEQEPPVAACASAWIGFKPKAAERGRLNDEEIRAQDAELLAMFQNGMIR